MVDYKDETYKLKEKCFACKKCPLGQELVDELDPHVFANGKVPAEIMVFGEAPGAGEQKQKTPLVGRSGQFFNNKILIGVDLNREDIYVSNVVHCRPEKNRTPFDGEIAICHEIVDLEICLNEPKLIITLGNVPLYGICETTGITKKRGILILSRIWSNSKQYPVFPMLHPSYCLRNKGLNEMSEDIEMLKTLVSKIKNGEEIWQTDY